jgi:hypothetical protein
MAKAPRKRSSIESKLQTALHIAEAAKEELAQAENKLKPLRRLAKKAVANAAKLLSKYQQQAGFDIFTRKSRRGGKRGKRSPEVRAKMAAAQRKRWAAKKKAEG